MAEVRKRHAGSLSWTRTPIDDLELLKEFEEPVDHSQLTDNDEVFNRPDKKYGLSNAHQVDKKTEKNLDKIFEHTLKNFSLELAQRVFSELRLATSKFQDFPEMGRSIGGYELKRQLVVSGNVVLYEILLSSEPFIVIRDVRPRGMGGR